MDNSNMDQNYYNSYTKKIIQAGRLTSLFGIIFSLAAPIYLMIKYGKSPSFDKMLSGYIIILSMFGISYFTDMVAFYPTAGLSGIYMGWFAGNMSGIRLPVMLAAHEALNVEAGTRKAEIIGTIAMGGSVFISIAATTLVALFGKNILQILPDFVLRSFDHVAPAIMGTLVAIIGMQHVNLFIISIILGLLVTFLPLPTLFNFPIVIFGTIGFAVWKYKKKQA